MYRQSFKKNRSISTDGRDIEEFGSLHNFLQAEDGASISGSQKNQFSFLQSPLNRTQISNQLNLFSTQKKRNSFSFNQSGPKSGQLSSTHKANPISLYDTFIKENSFHQYDKIPLDSKSPKIESVKEKKEGVIQKLFEIGNEMLKPYQKRNQNHDDQIADTSYDQKRSISLPKQGKLPLFSENSSPNMRYSRTKKLVDYKKIEGKTFAYENYVKGLVQLKEKSVELKEFSQNTHVRDNFIEEKVDRSHPIIIGLSSNYNTVVQSPHSPQEHDYKRHKMKKSQYLVRTAVKYIENQRIHESLSNYDKSFHRLKGVVVQGRLNGKLNQNPQFSKGDVEIISRYKQNAMETQEKENRKKQKSSISPKDQHIKQKNISSLESDDDESVSSVNSETRKFQEKQNEVKDKIMKEILNLKDKMTKKAIQRKFFSQSKAETFIRYQQVLDWARIHDKDKLESFQNFEKKVQQIKNVSSPQKPKEEQEGATQIKMMPFKSQEIMQRVLELDKVKQSNKLRSQMVKAKNKIAHAFAMNKLFGNNNNLLSPIQDEVKEFYDNTNGSPKQHRRSIFSRNKAISINSESDLDLNNQDFKRKLTNTTPKQQIDSISVSTPSNRKQSMSFTGQQEKCTNDKDRSLDPSNKSPSKPNTKGTLNNLIPSGIRKLSIPSNKLDENTVNINIIPSARKQSLSFQKQEEKTINNIPVSKLQNNIDYQKLFINGLDDVINDIHKGNYL